MDCEVRTLGSRRRTDLSRGMARVTARIGSKNRHVVSTYNPTPGLIRNELAIRTKAPNPGSPGEMTNALLINFSLQGCRSEPISLTCKTATAPKQPPTKLSVATAFRKQIRSTSAKAEKTSAPNTNQGTSNAIRKLKGIAKGSTVAGVSATGLPEAPPSGEDFIVSIMRRLDCS